MRRKNKLTILNCLLTILALLVAAPSRAHAGITQLLVNPGFEQNSGNKVPIGWTLFLPPEPNNPHTTDYWIEGNQATPHTGSEYWKEWGAGYFPPPTNNVAGIYQTFGSSAGSVYQASGWFYINSGDQLGANSMTWIDVAFLDANSNMLALYKSANFTANVGEDAWYEMDVTNVCNLSSPVATGDPYFTNYAVSGTVSQMTARAGTAQVRYRFCYLQAASDGGSCYFDDASLVQYSGLLAPVIANIFPQQMIFVPPTNGLSFEASSSSGTTINNSGIHVSLNGVDVSSSLVITGSASDKLISYQGLQSNTTYTASIKVTDVDNLSATSSNYFETTWVGISPVVYLWEAEDFDFTNGMYIDNPDLCNAPGDNNCYFGKVGTLGVDENWDGESVSHLYRTNDYINIDNSGDYLRPNLFLANRPDYEINPFDGGEWLNYTRDFPSGTYWLVGRLATDINISGSMIVSKVNSDSSLTPLGTMAITPHGLGWTTFENIYLLDTNGNKVNVTLNGKTTLQVQSQGNLLPNFFALVAAVVDQPILTGMYPTGTQPFEYTNALSFNIATVGASFPTSGIKVILDGFDVSSNLVITGPSTNETVVYPSLLLNAQHTAIISVTNSLGHGLLLTNNFDTFSQSNYMVYASDFDYNGGQYIPDADWYPNGYAGYDATTNIDYQHSPIEGELYLYRPSGVPQAPGHDFLTASFVNYGGIEYDLNWYGPGDWVNYTRTYPAGHYYVYVRTAGLGTNTMYLEQVTSGAGTVNQTVKKLGDWTSFEADNSVYAWVPLTDDGLNAPVLVNVTGLETFRLTTTTGDCYPNYFMFVPTKGIQIAAVKQGANASISFPTQNGAVYRVFYRNAVGSGIWTQLTNVLGNGGVESVSVSPSGSARFYRVTAP